MLHNILIHQLPPELPTSRHVHQEYHIFAQARL